MDNVVLFPSNKKDTPAQTLEEVYDRVYEAKTCHIEYIVDEFMEALCEKSYENGFFLLEDDNEGNVSLMVEAIRSALCNSVNIYRPLQDMVGDILKTAGIEVQIKSTTPTNILEETLKET